MYLADYNKNLLFFKTYLCVLLQCVVPMMDKVSGMGDRHPYHETSSDTEDYNDDRRRRVFKNRTRYFSRKWVCVYVLYVYYCVLKVLLGKEVTFKIVAKTTDSCGEIICFDVLGKFKYTIIFI